jgi:hypothetical protein
MTGPLPKSPQAVHQSQNTQVLITASGRGTPRLVFRATRALNNHVSSDDDAQGSGYRAKVLLTGLDLPTHFVPQTGHDCQSQSSTRTENPRRNAGFTLKYMGFIDDQEGITLIFTG